MKGARLALIDSGRDWGWRIVNFDTYRKMRDEEGRKNYNRNYMRGYMRKRRQALNQSEGSEAEKDFPIEAAAAALQQQAAG